MEQDPAISAVVTCSLRWVLKTVRSNRWALISDKKAEVLLTGVYGLSAFKTLETAGIKVVSDQSGRVMDVVRKFKQGNVVFADGANKDGHWGQKHLGFGNTECCPKKRLIIKNPDEKRI